MLLYIENEGIYPHSTHTQKVLVGGLMRLEHSLETQHKTHAVLDETTNISVIELTKTCSKTY